MYVVFKTFRKKNRFRITLERIIKVAAGNYCAKNRLIVLILQSVFLREIKNCLLSLFLHPAFLIDCNTLGVSSIKKIYMN